jgi:hypothetical protein
MEAPREEGPGAPRCSLRHGSTALDRRFKPKELAEDISHSFPGAIPYSGDYCSKKALIDLSRFEGVLTSRSPDLPFHKDFRKQVCRAYAVWMEFVYNDGSATGRGRNLAEDMKR